MCAAATTSICSPLSPDIRYVLQFRLGSCYQVVMPASTFLSEMECSDGPSIYISFNTSHPDCHKTYCNPLKPSTVLKTCDMWNIVLLSFSFMIYKLDHELWINCFFSSFELVFVISMELWKFLIL